MDPVDHDLFGSSVVSAGAKRAARAESQMTRKGRNDLIRRYTIGYLSILGIFLAFAIVSIGNGAGWRPALSGTPAYVSLLVLMTYNLLRDIYRIRVRERENKSPEVDNRSDG